jgi:hypothetical protein
MKPRIEDRGWTTEKEIMFLSADRPFTLGRSHESTKSIPRKEMLSRYLEGANKRTDWGDMDKFKIIAHVEKLLEELK